MQIDFPFHFDSRGGLAAADEVEHVLDMIRLLLLTSPGERVNRPDFGAGMTRMVFEPNSTSRAVQAEINLRTALQQHLPDTVLVREILVDSDDASLLLSLTYAVISTGETRTTIIPI